MFYLLFQVKIAARATGDHMDLTHYLLDPLVSFSVFASQASSLQSDSIFQII